MSTKILKITTKNCFTKNIESIFLIGIKFVKPENMYDILKQKIIGELKLKILILFNHFLR